MTPFGISCSFLRWNSLSDDERDGWVRISKSPLVSVRLVPDQDAFRMEGTVEDDEVRFLRDTHMAVKSLSGVISPHARVSYTEVCHG